MHNMFSELSQSILDLYSHYMWVEFKSDINMNILGEIRLLYSIKKLNEDLHKVFVCLYTNKVLRKS